MKDDPKRPDSRTNDDRNQCILIDCQRIYSEGNLRLDSLLMVFLLVSLANLVSRIAITECLYVCCCQLNFSPTLWGLDLLSRVYMDCGLIYKTDRIQCTINHMGETQALHELPLPVSRTPFLQYTCTMQQLFW